MTYGQRRRLFSRLVPLLLLEMTRRGYEYELDEGFVGLSVDRPSEDSPHRRDGGHFDGTAQDVKLYRCEDRPAHVVGACPTPTYLSLTESHAPFGRFWKGLHPRCEWGGDFAHLDGNHYGLKKESAP